MAPFTKEQNPPLPFTPSQFKALLPASLHGRWLLLFFFCFRIPLELYKEHTVDWLKGSHFQGICTKSYYISSPFWECSKL